MKKYFLCLMVSIGLVMPIAMVEGHGGQNDSSRKCERIVYGRDDFSVLSEQIEMTSKQYFETLLSDLRYLGASQMDRTQAGLNFNGVMEGFVHQFVGILRAVVEPHPQLPGDFWVTVLGESMHIPLDALAQEDRVRLEQCGLLHTTSRGPFISFFGLVLFYGSMEDRDFFLSLLNENLALIEAPLLLLLADKTSPLFFGAQVWLSFLQNEPLYAGRFPFVTDCLLRGKIYKNNNFLHLLVMQYIKATITFTHDLDYRAPWLRRIRALLPYLDEASLNALNENGLSPLMLLMNFDIFSAYCHSLRGFYRLGALPVLVLLLDHPLIDAFQVGQERGHTILMMAAANGYTEVVRRLLEIPGIDVEARNRDAKTALDIARELHENERKKDPVARNFTYHEDLAQVIDLLETHVDYPIDPFDGVTFPSLFGELNPFNPNHRGAALRTEVFGFLKLI
jgi:hypothetical protein